MTDVVVTAGAFVVALAAWVLLFRVRRSSIWVRSWIVAATCTSFALAATAITGRLARLIGPVSAQDLAAGVAAGALWLAVTQLVARVTGRVYPPFRAAAAGLYGDATDASRWLVAGALTAMAVAEELVFRGVIQSRVGLAVAVGLYAAVQLVAGKWLLVAAAAACGLVWGGLFAWHRGLIAPVVAHAIWTLGMTLVWPLQDATGGRAGRYAAPSDRVPAPKGRSAGRRPAVGRFLRQRTAGLPLDARERACLLG